MNRWASLEHKSLCPLNETNTTCFISTVDSIAFQRVKLKHQENYDGMAFECTNETRNQITRSEKAISFALINTYALSILCMESKAKKNSSVLSYKIQYLFRRRLSDFIFYVIALKSKVVESKYSVHCIYVLASITGTEEYTTHKHKQHWQLKYCVVDECVHTEIIQSFKCFYRFEIFWLVLKTAENKRQKMKEKKSRRKRNFRSH